MKAVCEKYGALLICDEIMCGMGRCGTLHAWEEEGVVPDIQSIGKGLGGGYTPVSGILIGESVVEVIDKGSGAFRHGQTYQGHPVSCAAALAVQQAIQEQSLLQNVRKMGAYLESQLRQRLEDHPYVGDIRGRGLFWGVSFPHLLAQIVGIMLITFIDRIRQGQRDKGAIRPQCPSPFPHSGNGSSTRIQHFTLRWCRHSGWHSWRSCLALAAIYHFEGRDRHHGGYHRSGLG